MNEDQKRVFSHWLKRLAWLAMLVFTLAAACTGRKSHQPVRPPAGADLLPAPPISSGISGWEIWLQPGSRDEGVNEVKMVEDSSYGRVVEFSRSSSKDGGAAGIILPYEIDARAYPHMYLWLVFRILHEDGGNLANSNPRWFPEGAVQVRIKYTTPEGEDAEWYHGFYYSEVKGADDDHFTRIEQERWLVYLSPDLMGLNPQPKQITETGLYGFGWSFAGQAAEIRLIGTNVEVE